MEEEAAGKEQVKSLVKLEKVLEEELMNVVESKSKKRKLKEQQIQKLKEQYSRAAQRKCGYS